MLVQKSIYGSGGFWNGSIVDECIDSFCDLVEQIEKFNCLAGLKLDVEKSLKLIFSRQYNNLYSIHEPNKKHTDPLESYDLPRELREKISDAVIQNYLSRKDPKPTIEQGRYELNDGIEAYAKLYAIKVKLNNLEHENAQTHLLRSRITS